MKKGILIIAVAIAGLLSGLIKVSALSWDGKIYTQHQVWQSDKKYEILDGGSLNYQFDYDFTTNSNENLVTFSINGVQYAQQSLQSPETLESWKPYLRIYLVTNGMWYICELQNNLIACPIHNGVRATGLIIEYNVDNNFQGVIQDFTIWVGSWANTYTLSTQQIIDNQNQNTQEIINQNATYSDQPKEETEGKNETADYEQKEQQLMGSLDFNMTAMDNITINPNASTFIWNITDRLRQINPAIILLMTSILGMGIIKLILNR